MSNKSNQKIITRIPPSPTGNLHVGTARTALFNFLFAKQNGGEIVLRFEDTDKERSEEKYEKNIIKGLSWLRITYDKQFKQSERSNIYEKYLNKLIEEKKAYVSKESIDSAPLDEARGSREQGQRSEVIRFKNPNKKIKFKDEVRGDIEFDTTDLGDFVIAKSLTEPLYHLAVVIDDFEMGITHIIRGEDGISNTPRQILIQKAIGAPLPTYIHLPMVLGKDKSKLSKRHGATSILEYKKEGYLPEAMINYLALLGWNPGTGEEQEIFSLDELIEKFDLSKVQKGGAVFNTEKLDWFNKHYLSKLEESEALIMLKDKFEELEFEIDVEMLEKIKPIIFEKISKISDIDIMIKDGELDYFVDDPKYHDPEKIIWKKSNKETTKKHLEYISNKFDEVAKFDELDNIKDSIWKYAEDNGKGDVLWPLRFALSGADRSPDPFQLAFILGKDVTLKRIQNAIKEL